VGPGPGKPSSLTAISLSWCFGFFFSSFSSSFSFHHQPDSNCNILNPEPVESLPTPHYTEKSWCHFSLPLLLAPNLPVHQLAAQTGEHHGTMQGSPTHSLGSLTSAALEQTDSHLPPAPTKLKNKQ
jgi:hypothetical protein